MWMPVSCSSVFSVHATPRSVWLPYRLPRANASLILYCGGGRHLPVAHLAGRDVHPRVTRDRHHVDPLPVGRDVHDHQRVRLVGGQVLPEALALVVPGVRADDHDVLGLRVCVHRLGAEVAGDVQLMQIAVQVPVDRVGAAHRDQQDHCDAACGPGQDLLPPPRMAAAWRNRYLVTARLAPARLIRRTARAGALRASALRDSALRASALRDSALRAGALRAGALRAGALRAGALRASALRADALRRAGLTRRTVRCRASYLAAVAGSRAPVVVPLAGRHVPLARARLIHVSGPHAFSPHTPMQVGGPCDSGTPRPAVAQRHILARKPSHSAQRDSRADSFTVQ